MLSEKKALLDEIFSPSQAERKFGGALQQDMQTKLFFYSWRAICARSHTEFPFDQ
jgi:hypothetical protein